MRRSDITIGSHTRRHALLTLESEKRVMDETIGSRRDLEQRLGAGVLHFAYPNGWFDDATIAAVRAAGYRFAYTSCRHRDPDHPLLTLPRTLLWRNQASGRSATSRPPSWAARQTARSTAPGSVPCTAELIPWIRPSDPPPS